MNDRERAIEIDSEDNADALLAATRRGGVATLLCAAVLVWECALSGWLTYQYYHGGHTRTPSYIQLLNREAARLFG